MARITGRPPTKVQIEGGLPQGQTYSAWGLPFRWEPCGPPPPSHSGPHTTQSDTEGLGQEMKKGLVPCWGLHSRSLSLGLPSLESEGCQALFAGWVSGLGAASHPQQPDGVTLGKRRRRGSSKFNTSGNIE